MITRSVRCFEASKHQSALSFRLFGALFAAMLMLAACGDDSSSPTVTPDPCNGACPAEQCRFGMCIAVSNGGQDVDVADTANDTGGTGDDVGDDAADDVGDDVTDDVTPDSNDPDVEDDVAMDVADVPPGCMGDDECEASEYCIVEDGVCEEGCRVDGCEEGFDCNLNTRECTETGRCQNDDACDDDAICVIEEGEDLGVCIDRCTSDDDCFGQICELGSGLCVADTCEGVADCAQGFYCNESLCEIGCDEASDCGDPADGFECNFENNACEGVSCGNDEECPQGLYCEPNTGQCTAGCRVDLDCAFGEICDTEDPRACRPGCRTNDNCAPAEYCVPDALICADGCRDNEACGLGFQCTEVEIEDAEGNIEERRRCVEVPCEDDASCDDASYCLDGACMEGCRIDGETSNCDIGFFCDSDTRECLQEPCTNSDVCDNGLFCDTGLGECVPGCDSDEQCPINQPCVLETNTCGCETAEDCGSDEVCSLGECLPRCENDDACAEGFFCNDDLGLCVEGCRDDGFEPNNDPESPLPLEPGVYDLRMCYSAQIGQDDEDCFALPLGDDDEVSVDAMFTHGDGNLDMQLYNSINQLVASSTSATNNESLDFTATLSGVHVLCVRPLGLGFESDYSLSVDVVRAEGCIPDIDEANNNDTCVDAADDLVEMLPGDELMFDDRTVCAGDNDYRAIELRTGQELTVTLVRTSDDGQLDVQVIGPDCTAILARTETFDPTREIVFQAPADGIYTVRVFGELADEEGVYDLGLRLAAGNAMCRVDRIDNNPAEPNETLEQAVLVQYERDVNKVIEELNMCQEDEDWYQLVLPQPNELIQATLSQSVNEEPLLLEILDDEGNVLAMTVEDTALKTTMTPELMSAGTYYVRVSPTAEPAEAGLVYGLTLLVTAANQCMDDDFEPNNSANESPLVGSEVFDAFMCREDATESDWYAFLVGPGDEIDLSVNWDWDMGNGMRPFVIGYLRGPDLSQKDFLFQDFNDPNIDNLLNGARTVGGDEAGLWYLELQAAGAGASLGYSVDINIEAVSCEEEPDDYEGDTGNEDCMNAAPIEAFTDVQGYVCGPDSDQDWFSVSVAVANQTLDVFLEHFHFDGNLELEVYEPGTGMLVGSSYNAGPNFEQVVIEDTVVGNYCIKVFERDGFTQNRYTLEATFE